MARKPLDKLPVPVKLSIALPPDQQFQIVNLEHYEDKKKFFIALECLFSKQAYIKSIYFKYAWSVEKTPKRYLTDIYVNVDKSWSPLLFTEKRYRGKITNIDELNWVEVKLSMTTMEEFRATMLEIYPELGSNPDDIETKLKTGLASKMNKFS